MLTDDDKMWAYVAYTDGKRLGKSYMKKSCLTKISDTKYKVSRDDGNYYEGVILCESDSKAGLKNMVLDFEPPFDKSCLKDFPTRIIRPEEDFKRFLESENSQQNWKKRLINSAIELTNPIESSVPENLTEDLELNQVNKEPENESVAVNQNIINILKEPKNSAKSCNERHNSPMSVKSDMPLISAQKIRTRRLFSYNDIEQSQNISCSSLVNKNQISQAPNKVPNRRLSKNSMDSVSLVSEDSCEIPIEVDSEESDSDDPTYDPHKKKRALQVFPFFKPSVQKITRKHQSRSDSISFSPNISQKSWDHNEKNYQILKEPINENKVLKRQILEKFEEYLDSANNMPNLIQEILKSRKPIGRAQQLKQPMGSCITKKRHSIADGELKLRRMLEGKRKKIKEYKLNESKTASNQSSDDSTSSNQLVRFRITNVYSLVPYTKDLKDIFKGNDIDNTEKDVDSSVIDYVASTVPLSNRIMHITIMDCDESSEEEYDDADTHNEIMKYNQEFQDLREEHALMMKKLKKNSKKKFYNSNKANLSYNSKIHRIIKNSLPSKSLEEFLKLNDLLKESLIHQEELKNIYRAAIRKETSIRNCIKKIMLRTLATDVGLEYSGTGKKFRGITKLNYSETKTFHCLNDVLIEKFGPIPELNHLSSQVGQWLSINSNRYLKPKMKITAT